MIWKLSTNLISSLGNISYLLVSWDIGAYDGANTLQSGQVWLNRYSMGQYSPLDNFGANNVYDPNYDLNLFTVNPDGYAYQITDFEYNGLGSIFNPSATGIVYDNTCTSAYRSVFRNNMANILGEDLGYSLPNANCEPEYKIFFSNPLNASLPASASLYDGTTIDIIKPIEDVEMSLLSYDQASLASVAGEVTIDVRNYIGTGTLQLDLDNDGVFEGVNDRNIAVTVKQDGVLTFNFDGKDKNGNSIPLGSKIGFRFIAEKPGEIHFVSEDAERRAGGINIKRLNGSSVGRDVIFWDDSHLSSAKCGTTNIQPLQNLSGVDSSAGVHSWDWDGCVLPNGSPSNGAGSEGYTVAEYSAVSSWGDGRYIDDWTWDTGIDLAKLTSEPLFVEPRLAVSKTTDKSSYTVGDAINYRLIVTNTGGISSSISKLTDNLPEQIKVAESDLPQGCLLVSPQVVSCDIPSLMSDQSYEVIIKATLEVDGSDIVNTAAVSGGGDSECVDGLTVDALPGRCKGSVTINNSLAETGQGSIVVLFAGSVIVLAGIATARRGYYPAVSFRR